MNVHIKNISGSGRKLPTDHRGSTGWCPHGAVISVPADIAKSLLDAKLFEFVRGCEEAQIWLGLIPPKLEEPEFIKRVKSKPGPKGTVKDE